MPLTDISLPLATWGLLAVLGGLLAVDGVSVPQVMISRPLISATLGGAVMGSAAGGMLVGALLELLSMRHPPYGAAKYPDTGPAGLIAGAAYAEVGGGSLEGLVAALLVGWVIGWIGAYAAYGRRRINERLTLASAFLAEDPRRLERRHRLAIGLDVMRGMLLTGGLLIPAILLVALVALIPNTPAGTAIGATAVVTLLAASIGSAARTTAPDVRAWAMVLLGAVMVLTAIWVRAW